jgi:hypothetical protein
MMGPVRQQQQQQQQQQQPAAAQQQHVEQATHAGVCSSQASRTQQSLTAT